LVVGCFSLECWKIDFFHVSCFSFHYLVVPIRTSLMQHTISLSELQSNAEQQLGLLFERIALGDEVLVTQGNKPLATIRPAQPARSELSDAIYSPAQQKPQRRFGICPDLIASIADDFDAPLADLNEYM
jgi:antitoxin (DNA-binding transcriptional repressor) of toxin-antitoxin stability system